MHRKDGSDIMNYDFYAQETNDISLGPKKEERI
jgi:hypothetical protein